MIDYYVLSMNEKQCVVPSVLFCIWNYSSFAKITKEQHILHCVALESTLK